MTGILKWRLLGSTHCCCLLSSACSMTCLTSWKIIVCFIYRCLNKATLLLLIVCLLVPFCITKRKRAKANVLLGRIYNACASFHAKYFSTYIFKMLFYGRTASLFSWLWSIQINCEFYTTTPGHELCWKVLNYLSHISTKSAKWVLLMMRDIKNNELPSQTSLQHTSRTNSSRSSRLWGRREINMRESRAILSVISERWYITAHRLEYDSQMSCGRFMQIHDAAGFLGGGLGVVGILHH